MIPRAHLQAWSATTPWREQRQVEQDLIICRALCDIFREPFLAERLAFRGGTAIHKLLFRQPLRYSQDIDLVQRRAEPIGPTVNALRDVLSWLGPLQRDTAAHSLHLNYRFIPESEPTVRAKVKVEINTREHEYLYGVRTYPFTVENPWYTGQVSVVSFEPEELFIQLEAQHARAEIDGLEADSKFFRSLAVITVPIALHFFIVEGAGGCPHGRTESDARIVARSCLLCHRTAAEGGHTASVLDRAAE